MLLIEIGSENNWEGEDTSALGHPGLVLILT